MTGHRTEEGTDEGRGPHSQFTFAFDREKMSRLRGADMTVGDSTEGPRHRSKQSQGYDGSCREYTTGENVERERGGEGARRPHTGRHSRRCGIIEEEVVEETGCLGLEQTRPWGRPDPIRKEQPSWRCKTRTPQQREEVYETVVGKSSRIGRETRSRDTERKSSANCDRDLAGVRTREEDIAGLLNKGRKEGRCRKKETEAGRTAAKGFYVWVPAGRDTKEDERRLKRVYELLLDIIEEENGPEDDGCIRRVWDWLKNRWQPEERPEEQSPKGQLEVYQGLTEILAEKSGKGPSARIKLAGRVEPEPGFDWQ
ncbi:hypothetical protein AAG570_004894 [Ranatra chinensis]|uniref:Uncharacterized protein n=1 Tax=Ranatra chinensis TaxID=642074 RepID=A0ABD0YMF6_9HEMI